MTGKNQIHRILTEADLSQDEIKELTKKIEPSYSHHKGRPYTISTTRRRFGIVGDTHINSDTCNMEFLHAVYEWFKKEKADFVVQTGDLTEGEEMRRDQKFNLTHQGVGRVVSHVAETYPNIGLTTYFIAGNHDQAYFKHGGVDICDYIASKRPDMVYLGMNEGSLPAEVINTKVKLWHPSKGTAKGQSYQIQELVNYFVNKDEEKPNILIIGHYHKFDYLFYHNVHAYQAGTMQNQSDWMRTKNLAADLNCWLIDVYTKPSGEVDRIHNHEISWEQLKCRTK